MHEQCTCTTTAWHVCISVMWHAACPCPCIRCFKTGGSWIFIQIQDADTGGCIQRSPTGARSILLVDACSPYRPSTQIQSVAQGARTNRETSMHLSWKSHSHFAHAKSTTFFFPDITPNPSGHRPQRPCYAPARHTCIDNTVTISPETPQKKGQHG